MTGWPAVVWTTPILRGLDELSRAALERAGRIVEHRAAAAIYRDGDDSDSFFVVAGGSVELHAIRRGDGAASLLRTARPGDSFGEEALLPGIPRRLTATGSGAAVVVEIPIAVFQRITGRAGGADREQRYLERAAARDLLACSAFARDLGAGDVELLLDAVKLERMPRGTRIYEPGAAADRLYFVVDGLVQLQREDDAAGPAVTAYLARGDFFGDQEALAGVPRRTAAVASGDTWCAAVPGDVLRTLSDRNPGLLPALRRVAETQEAVHGEVIGAASARSTQHVFRDLYRMQMARSLLVIDQEACVRCGHCAWSCEQVHGTSRLIRRGDKVVTQLGDTSTGAATLLLPNTCQHCRHAACMIDCPTGAIGRDPEGEVFIRPSLCTGCGNCAKACPWENIQMAPRVLEPGKLVLLGSKRAERAEDANRAKYASGAEDANRTALAAPAASSVHVHVSRARARARSSSTTHVALTPHSEQAVPGHSAEIAVKCDLCHGFEAPACVEACPTGAVLRLDPARDVAEVARVLGTATGAQGRARLDDRGGLSGSIAAAGAIAATAAGWAWHRAHAGSPGRGVALVAGIVAALLVIALAAYVLPKRRVRARMRRRDPLLRLVAEERPVPRSRTRIHLVAHLGLGALVPAAVLVHAGAHVRATPGGALAAALAITVVLGVLAAIAYRVVPRALTRLERRGTLPEDLAGERDALEARLYRAVTGQSDRVKALADHVLLPYARARLGPVWLVASGRGLADEQRRLRRRIDGVLAGRVIDGVPELIEIAVELRALPARRLLGRLLRIWPPLHMIAGAMTVALLVVHVVTAVLR